MWVCEVDGVQLQDIRGPRQSCLLNLYQTHEQCCQIYRAGDDMTIILQPAGLFLKLALLSVHMMIICICLTSAFIVYVHWCITIYCFVTCADKTCHGPLPEPMVFWRGSQMYHVTLSWHSPFPYFKTTSSCNFYFVPPLLSATHLS